MEEFSCKVVHVFDFEYVTKTFCVFYVPLNDWSSVVRGNERVMLEPQIVFAI